MKVLVFCFLHHRQGRLPLYTAGRPGAVLRTPNKGFLPTLRFARLQQKHKTLGRAPGRLYFLDFTRYIGFSPSPLRRKAWTSR